VGQGTLTDIQVNHDYFFIGLAKGSCQVHGNVGLTGTGTTWDASGAASKEPKAVAIENGAYVDAEKAE
jgi:hypothetical protein